MEQPQFHYVSIKDIQLNDVLVQTKVLSRTHWNIGVVDEINSESVRIRLLQHDDTTTIRTNIVPLVHTFSMFTCSRNVSPSTINSSIS